MPSVMMQHSKYKREVVHLLSSEMQQQKQQIDWRRTKVLELSSQGLNQSDIAGILKVDKSIVSRDIKYLRLQASKIFKNISRTNCQKRISALYNRNESGAVLKK